MARTKGTKQFNASISEAIADGFIAFCESRGETVRYHVELAFRRHMANPPPLQEPPPLPPAPPLPPVVAPAVELEKAAPKKPKGKK